MFAALKLLTVWIGLGVPAAVIAMPWAALRDDFRLMYRWGMGIVRLGVETAGVSVRLEGLENLPAQPCIFVSNHVSNIDAPVLLPALPGMSSVFIKKKLMSIPILGMAMRMGKYIPVSRGHSREEAQRSVEYAAEVLRGGRNIVLFPEGTRSPDGKLLPFKKGGFFLAAETGAPMVPVVIRGTAKIMRKGSFRIYPGEAVVRFLPVVWPEQFEGREALMQAVREEMENALAKDAAQE
jgi:1-acyl-sn-glycerol-3-phosphate acyltransferase